MSVAWGPVGSISSKKTGQVQSLQILLHSTAPMFRNEPHVLSTNDHGLVDIYSCSVLRGTLCNQSVSQSTRGCTTIPHLRSRILNFRCSRPIPTDFWLSSKWAENYCTCISCDSLYRIQGQGSPNRLQSFVQEQSWTMACEKSSSNTGFELDKGALTKWCVLPGVWCCR